MELHLILVTGKNGQVGTELQQLSKKFAQHFRFVFCDKEARDISNETEVLHLFEQYKPAFCINCAAYNAVDKDETNQQQAYAVNADAVSYLAKACSKYNAVLVSFSTDYVIEGTATRPYLPDSLTNPINYYGYTKYMGEKLALANCAKAIIIRTSWVYSSYGNNFVKTMIRLMKEKNEIGVVSDQYGSPTFAADLALAVMTIITRVSTQSLQSVPYGIYHYANQGIISWYQFALAIQQNMQLQCKVNAITTAQFPTAAKRPAYNGLNTEKITQVFGIRPPEWQNSLQACLKILKK
jgi:dTDP-4-dehydrorhamnose reductase